MTEAPKCPAKMSDEAGSTAPVQPPPLPSAAAPITDEPTAPPLAGDRAPPTEMPAALRWWELWQSAKFHERAHSFGISLAIHLAVLLVLAMVVYVADEKAQIIALLVQPAVVEEPEPLTMLAPPTNTALEPGDIVPRMDEAVEATLPFDLPDFPSTNTDEPEPQPSPMPVVDQGSLPATGLLQNRPSSKGGLKGRSDDYRSQLVGRRGGTPGSEDAVKRALAWLAAHQHKNGSWHFDHRGEMCDGLCRDPGTAGTTTGATALALLPFLGAGHTHERGEYQQVVKQGLYYLQARMRATPRGGDFMEGTMYAQGLSAIALCEAYAMTKDKELRPYAQEAIDFICDAQHVGGGWRYFPGQPGDTTVFGWQFMALKSAYLANLEVPSPVIERASRYLDSVQTEKGANYGYLKPAKDPTPTAVGLLARMYLGWPHDKPQLAAGTAYLAKLGPSAEDMYFNYYATQVLHHYEGPQWDKWNTKLREHLIKTQATTGHEAGSWFFPDKHGLSGGRLYTTAMCTMILEVYYRHLPIYGERSVDEGF